MLRVATAELVPGMVLGRTVYGERGEVLFRAGVALTGQYVEALRTRALYRVYVSEETEPGRVQPPREPVSEFNQAQLARATHALLQMFSPQTKPGEEVRLRATVQAQFLRLARETEVALLESAKAEALSGFVSAKNPDGFVAWHAEDVTVAALLLGRRVGLDATNLRQLAYGCLLHDVGKLGPKATPGLDEDASVPLRHPEEGYRLIRLLLGSLAGLARYVAWQHHERQDGSGYPRGLRGGNRIRRDASDRYSASRILLLAEIAAVAETYAELATDDGDRVGLPPSEIAVRLRELAGGSLNRELVALFLHMLRA